LSGTARTGRARLVLITGLSGSGKTTLANCLEDLGYYVADNMPLALLERFLADPIAHADGRQRIGVVADLRCGDFAVEGPRLWRSLDRDRLAPTLIFLEASSEALLRRFSESRRPHPLGSDVPLSEAIGEEKRRLADLRGMADLVLDTSDWSAHEMRSLVYRRFGREQGYEPAMTVSLLSFGYKHGLPSEADLVFDVRFLANPHYVPELREKSGRDRAVTDFLDEQRDFGELLERLSALVGFLLPRYQQENRSYLTIAVGCTGGRHRSVAVVERLATRLQEEGWGVDLRHRDLEGDRG